MPTLLSPFFIIYPSSTRTGEINRWTAHALPRSWMPGIVPFSFVAARWRPPRRRQSGINNQAELALDLVSPRIVFTRPPWPRYAARRRTQAAAPQSHRTPSGVPTRRKIEVVRPGHDRRDLCLAVAPQLEIATDRRAGETTCATRRFHPSTVSARNPALRMSSYWGSSTSRGRTRHHWIHGCAAPERRRIVVRRAKDGSSADRDGLERMLVTGHVLLDQHRPVGRRSRRLHRCLQA